MVPPPDYTADEMAAHDASAKICADGSQHKGTLSESAPRGANHFGQKRGECGRTFVGIVQGKTAVPTGNILLCFFKETSAFRKKDYYEYRPKCPFSFDGYSGSFEKRGRG